jgi:2'-5' RNA ligase
MKQIRAFIAIELPEGFKASLSQIQAKLKPGRELSVKWVDPQGLHLTLKFLGNIALPTVSEVTEAIAGVASSVAPFRLELIELGAFPDIHMPRVVWVGLGGDLVSLLGLQEGIDSSLIPLGFSSEGRAFSPHLTLGRVRDRASAEERRRLGVELSSLQLREHPVLPVEGVSLMRSKLTKEGAIYSRLAWIALATSP